MAATEVLVLDNTNQLLCAVHPALARKLLKSQKAQVHSKTPFIIKLYGSTLPTEERSPNMNFTEYFKEEREVYVQNISNAQVSVTFDVGPGHSESHLFTATRDPVCLTRYIPWAAIKSSMDFRKMMMRVPPALRLLTDEEYQTYYTKRAQSLRKDPAQVEAEAEAQRQAIQNHQLPPVTTGDLVDDVAPKETKVADVVVSENEEINARVLHLCLQVHHSVPDQSKMPAQVFLQELELIPGLTEMDWAYIQSHGYYKSVKNLAKTKLATMVSTHAEPDETEVAEKKKPKPAKKKDKGTAQAS